MLIIVEHEEDRYLLHITEDIQNELHTKQEIGYSYAIEDKLTGETKFIPFNALYRTVFGDKNERVIGDYKLYRYD
jgi:hypothetical protein